MTSDWIVRTMTRDLKSLGEQIDAYPDEADIWELVRGISNSAGTLALHLAGNLQHYIGAQLGGSGYVRNRNAEFASRGVPRSELLQEIAAASTAVEEGLAGLSDEALEGEYPLEVAGVKLTKGVFLVHLATHLAYHLGQLDYHRRLLTGEAGLADMCSVAVLASSDGEPRA